jgi:hypothetical protein
MAELADDGRSITVRYGDLAGARQGTRAMDRLGHARNRRDPQGAERQPSQPPPQDSIRCPSLMKPQVRASANARHFQSLPPRLA